MVYYMIIEEGSEGWIGYSLGTVDGKINLMSPLGSGNMTGTGLYEKSHLVEITESEYLFICEPLIKYIIEDLDFEQEYLTNQSLIMNKYGI